MMLPIGQNHIPEGTDSLVCAQDDDGSAYVAYSSENNMVMHIARLRPDYLAPEPDYKRVGCLARTWLGAG